MDRIREGRRGVSGGGPVSAPRRPRTSGFKDSSAVEEDDGMDEANNSRLRERSKKESSSFSSPVFSGNIVSNSRNKRRRQSAQEVHVHVRSSTAEDMDESTEETEIGVSEDEDDLPPPPISRRLGKFKLQEKPADDSGAVDISAVPRKARTAMMKRPQESPPPPVADCVAKQPLPSSVPSFSAATNSVPSSSNVVLKPGRRTKPFGLKPRAPKLPKVSTPTSVSEQEVEVAEALFDLARMVPNQTSPSVSESKIELTVEAKPEMKVVATAAAVSPPAPTSAPPVSGSAHTCIPASPLPGPQNLSPVLQSVSWSGPAGSSSPVPVVGPPPAEAPKRKRHRVKKTEDGGSSQAHPAGLPSNNSGVITPEHTEENEPQPLGTENIQAKAEASTMVSINSLMGSPPALLSIAASSPSSTVHRPHSVEKTSLAIRENIAARTDNRNNTSLEKLPTSASLTERKVALGNLSDPNSSQKDNDTVGESSGFGDSLTKLELGKRVAQPSSSDTTRPVKFEFDLMEPPKPMAVVPNEKPADTSGPGIMEDEDKKELGATTKSSWMDREKKQEKDEDADSHRDKDKGNEIGEGKDLEGGNEQVASLDHGGQGETEFQRENLDERETDKTELLKDISQRTLKSTKALQKIEKSASTSLNNVPVSSLTNPLLQVSMGMAGWPGSLPLGYFSPAAAAAAAVAAAWPAAPSINGAGAASVDEHSIPFAQVPSFTFPGARQPWKHCSTHVYIAHFIDWQQQMQRHPLWVPTYGSTATSVYGAKPYNLNVPLPPSDGIFGNGAGVMTGPSGGTVVGPSSRGSSLSLGPSKDRSASATANTHVLKERVPSTYLDAFARKTRPQQPAQAQAGQQQQQPSLSLQAGPAFGFPVTHGGASAISGGVICGTTGNGVTAAGNATLVGGNSGPGSGSANAGGTGAVVGQGSGTTNGSVANAAAAQVQYLQAMMQQTGFPFSFPPTHFGPAFSGPPGQITQQQATQLFSNPFYSSHLVHPSLHSQQGQAAAVSASTGLTSSQKQQQHHLQQVARSYQASGSQQQQQLPPPPASPSQSHPQHTLGPPSHCPSDKEGNMGGDNSSLIESKFPAFQRSMYSQATPSVQVSNMNPSSSVLAAGMPNLSLHSQDFTLMAAFGAKPAGTFQQQQQASGQLQAQQQSSTSSQLQQQQQQHPIAQHNTSSPAFQLNFKGLESQASLAYSNVSLGNMTRSSVGPGPLGLAPVAAVMAPQGHAMLQTMADPSRCHTQSSHQSLPRQSHHHLVAQGQHQRSALMQRTNSNAVEDSRTNMDEISYTNSNRGRDHAEDRKLPVQKALVPASFSRADSEVSSIAQGSPNIGNGSGLALSRTPNNPGSPLNTMASSMVNFTSHQSGQSSGGILGSIHPANQQSKPGLGRAKTAPNSTVAPSAGLTDSSVSSFGDRNLGANLNKLPASGLPFTGQSISNGNQNLRQGPAAQQASQIKLSQRAPLVSPVHTPPGTPPAGPAASKHQGHSQSRGQQAAMSMAPGSRPSSVSGSPASGSIPLPPLPPVLKSSAATAAKTVPPAKNCFSLPQKLSGAPPVKRSTSVNPPTSTVILGPNPVTQSMPGKMAHPQQQQQIQHGIQQHLSQAVHQSQATLTASQQSMAQQYSQQQSTANQLPTHPLHKHSLQPQQLQMRQHLTLQQQQQQFFQQHHHQHHHHHHQQQQQQQHHHHHQHQDSTQSQSLSLVPQSQASMHQIQQSHEQSHGQQMQQQSVSINNQSRQQHPTTQQVHKLAQSHQALQSSHQSPPAAAFGAVTNGLSLTSPNLMLAAGSAGRTVSTEGVGPIYQAVSSRSATPIKPSGNSNGLHGVSSQRNTNAGPNFLHSQARSPTAGQEQAVMVGTTAEAISREPMNGICLMPVSSSGKQLQPTLPPPPHRPQTGGSTVNKHTGGQQFAGGNVEDMLSSRSGMTSSTSVHSGMLSSNRSLNTGSTSVNGSRNTVGHCLDGNDMLGGSNQSVSTSGQPVITIAVSVAATAAVAATANVASTSPGILVGQSSAGLVQP